MNMDELRGRIDAVDDELLRCFAERMDIAGDIARYKAEHGLPVLDERREREKLYAVSDEAPEERELLEQSEALLAHLREECPGFVFSNKIVALSERVRLENDLGRRLDDRQSGSFLNLVVKDEASPNVFDTGIGWTSRGNAAIDGLEAARRSLRGSGGSGRAI